MPAQRRHALNVTTCRHANRIQHYHMQRSPVAVLVWCCAAYTVVVRLVMDGDRPLPAHLCLLSCCAHHLPAYPTYPLWHAVSSARCAPALLPALLSCGDYSKRTLNGLEVLSWVRGARLVYYGLVPLRVPLFFFFFIVLPGGWTVEEVGQGFSPCSLSLLSHWCTFLPGMGPGLQHAVISLLDNVTPPTHDAVPRLAAPVFRRDENLLFYGMPVGLIYGWYGRGCVDAGRFIWTLGGYYRRGFACSSHVHFVAFALCGCSALAGRAFLLARCVCGTRWFSAGAVVSPAPTSACLSCHTL